jgi:MFS family permease
VLVWIANLFMEISYMLFLHFPGFLRDLGAVELEIGVIFGITAVAAILVRPAIGKAMDIRGRRTVILAAGVLNVAVTGLYLTVEAVDAWVYVVRIVNGLATARLFTVYFTYAADVVPAARRTQGLALFGISGMLPIALGGILGDLILNRSGFDALFVAALAAAAIALVLSLPLRDIPPSPTNAPRRSFLTAVRQPNLLPMWWLTLVFATALAAYFTFLKTFIDEEGFGSVGLFFGAYAGVAITLRVVAGWLPDRVGARRVLFPALGALAAGFVVLAQAQSATDVFLAGALCGAGHGYAFPIMYGMVVGRARDAERGSALATYTAMFDVGLLIGGPAFGAVIGLAGYRTMFLAAAALVVVGAAGYAWWDRVPPSPASPAVPPSAGQTSVTFSS